MTLFAFVLVGCVSVVSAGELADLHRSLAAPRPSVDAPPGDPGSPVRPLAPLPASPMVPDIERIGLERGPCFAGCPVFTLIVDQDGRFRFVGEQNVSRLGLHEGTVDRGTLALLFRFVAEIDFMSLEDSYESAYLDGPSSYTLVAWGGTTKIVLNYGGAAPARVWALEKLIELLLETATWND